MPESSQYNSILMNQIAGPYVKEFAYAKLYQD